MASNRQPEKGDLIEVNRKAPVLGTPYTHWGVCIEPGKIMHLSGPEGTNAKANALVQRTSLEKFIGPSKDIHVFPSPKSIDKNKVIERAISQENKQFRGKAYNLTTNNCEHFANWCRDGIAKSDQVDRAAADMWKFNWKDLGVLRK